MAFPFKSNKRSHSGDDGDEDPPVPIPNTEVKLIYGESSWHRAPARIANCRISIKKRPFSTENGRFSYIFKVFHLAHFVLYCLVFIKFLVNFQVKNTEISSVLFAFTQLVKTV